MKLTEHKDKRTELEKLVDEELLKLHGEINHVRKDKEGNKIEQNCRAEDLEKLIDLMTKRQALAEKKKITINWDVVIVAGASLIEIILMLNYEKIGVITSKVLSRVLRGRV